MSAMSTDASPDEVPERLVRAAVQLLAERGPTALKAREVATASGLSTMVVYSRFGGVAELVRAVIDHGFTELGEAFARVPATDDQVADLFSLALTCRTVAGKNPHLYDLMFGLSTRATYRPLAESGARLSGHSTAFRAAYGHVVDACDRLVRSGRVPPQDPDLVAAQLWSMVHGFISLELAQHFAELDDPVVQVLLPMGVNLTVGLGDTRKRAEASHRAVARLLAG